MDDSQETEPEEPDLTSEPMDEVFPPPSSTVRVQVAARSHPGGRPVNDDHFLIVELGRHQRTIATNLPDGEVPVRFEEAGYGMIVADGLGTAGATASRLAITTLAHLVLQFGKWQLRIDPDTADDVINRARRFYRQVDQAVTETGSERTDLSGMGATLTAAYSAGDTLFLAHVGHSRAYLFRDGVLTQLTNDQTVRQRIAESGPGPFEAAANELDHVLTDVIGGHARPARIQVGQFELRGEDCVLLCTNGLSDVVDDKSAAAVLGMRVSLDERCAALVDLALARGTKDNVTAVLAKYDVPRYRSDARTDPYGKDAAR
jgi:serine/threonine protein phosphatase PrpC